MDDTLLFEQWLSNLKTLEEPSFTTSADALNQDFSYSHHQQQQNPQVPNIKRSASEQSVIMNRPLKQQKMNNSATWDSSSLFVNSSTIHTTKNQMEIVRPKEEIPWSSTSSFLVFDTSSFENKDHTLKPCHGTTKSISGNIGVNNESIRPFTQAKEHILAERKRRERINERLISLSKLIPGLSKMDKATVLADAVKYIKQLQEKVKSLEEKTDKIKTMESHVIYVKRCDNICNNNSSSDETSSDGSVTTTTTESLLPEIEARVCNKDVLISIHSQKKKGALERLVAEIEKLHLTVVNSSVMSFGDSALNISVVAQMDEEFHMNMSQLVTSLHEALHNLYN